MATSSKEGSRRANYPILTQGGSDNKYQYWVSLKGLVIGMKNPQNPYLVTIWGESLVPAAAVIPAPKVYIKAVAVKKLVVETLITKRKKRKRKGRMRKKRQVKFSPFFSLRRRRGDFVCFFFLFLLFLFLFFL